MACGPSGCLAGDWTLVWFRSRQGATAVQELAAAVESAGTAGHYLKLELRRAVAQFETFARHGLAA